MLQVFLDISSFLLMLAGKTESVFYSCGSIFISARGKENTRTFKTTRGSSPDIKFRLNFVYVSLRLRVQNAVPAQPCVGKLGISLVLLNFLHCNFRLWFKTP